ncbi:myosin-IIIa [Caerostris extrusa]|uniref:Myosin-IIIa n=1 Tax=Caerostris extrusa TaxID=172846 RepID=A0AAV4RLC5_CAEEX|nr:myosin-IIIa [Caerostris extrusa]
MNSGSLHPKRLCRDSHHACIEKPACDREIFFFKFWNTSRRNLYKEEEEITLQKRASEISSMTDYSEEVIHNKNPDEPPPTLKCRTEWSETFRDFINDVNDISIWIHNVILIFFTKVCLERNEEHRPNILELLLHPFITAIDDSCNLSLTLEEHLQEEFIPTVGVRVKQVSAASGFKIMNQPENHKYELCVENMQHSSLALSLSPCSFKLHSVVQQACYNVGSVVQ